MDFALSKNNRLFWMGRYSERVYQGVLAVRDLQDQNLDGGNVDYQDLCRRLGITQDFSDASDFLNRYLFDRSLPDSLICAADAMLGNGMVLRETISSTTLSYLQMAVTALEIASTSAASGVELQLVLDDIMAFRGSCYEYVADEATRNIIKCGVSVERLSIQLRFDEQEEKVDKELHKLLNRLYKTHLSCRAPSLDLVTSYAFQKEDRPDRATLLQSVESLFQL